MCTSNESADIKTSYIIMVVYGSRSTQNGFSISIEKFNCHMHVDCPGCCWSATSLKILFTFYTWGLNFQLVGTNKKAEPLVTKTLYAESGDLLLLTYYI